MSGTLKDRERVTIDQDRCRSATHSLQQSHVDNIPPLSTASDARSSPLRAFSCPCPSVQASRPRSASLAAFWRSCCGVRSWAVARVRAPASCAPALAGEVRGGRLHVLPCADEIGAQWRFSWLVMTVFVQSMPRASKQQARYAVGRCLMLWSSNDVTQQGSRPKQKVNL